MLEHAGEPASLKIGFIGAGRLGRALAWSLHAHGAKIHAVASRNQENAAQLAENVQGCRIVCAQDVADSCDIVFLTTPDASIQATAEAIAWPASCGVVHCSGATEIDALAHAAACGASVGGFHPMQTFGDPEAAARTLPGCTVTIEAADEGLANALLGLASLLACPVNRLPPGARARYHAAAGFASQYINVVLGEATRIWESWGATEAAALAAMVPLVRGTLASIESAGLARGMPGPVSRGDVATVEKHMVALGAMDPATAALYRELCIRSVPLALAAGGISPQKAADFLEVLDQGPV